MKKDTPLAQDIPEKSTHLDASNLASKVLAVLFFMLGIVDYVF